MQAFLPHCDETDGIVGVRAVTGEAFAGRTPWPGSVTKSFAFDD
jgi:hypothetical protein